MATESLGLPFEVGTLSAWLVWILPFAAAMIIPGVGKLSQTCNWICCSSVCFDECFICSNNDSSCFRGS